MRKVLIAIALAFGVTACVSMIQPMVRVENVPVTHPEGAEGVGAAIERALAARNWVVTARRPGEVDASLIGAEFRADITVPYTANAYSIRYRDSQGLDYDGALIHRHYNNWMNNLRISIERELIALPPRAAPAAAAAPETENLEGATQ